MSERGRSRSGDRETSRIAGENVNAGRLNLIVLEFLQRTYPRTWAEIEVARHVGIDKWSITPRFVQLEEKGLIELVKDKDGKPLKERRLNSNNQPRLMILWRAIPQPKPEPEPIGVAMVKDQARWSF